MAAQASGGGESWKPPGRQGAAFSPSLLEALQLQCSDSKSCDWAGEGQGCLCPLGRAAGTDTPCRGTVKADHLKISLLNPIGHAFHCVCGGWWVPGRLAETHQGNKFVKEYCFIRI